MNPVFFLKLGGSLITEKDVPHKVRTRLLRRIASEIHQVLEMHPGMRLLVGHGSGSFGHYAAQKYGTRSGVHTPEEWRGFADVWHEARLLNAIVMDNLIQAGIPAIAFSPCAQVTAENRTVTRWETAHIRSAFKSGLVPVIYGDVVFDRVLGGTILSTEELFAYLAGELKPARILIAGTEPGVWSDYPERKVLLPTLTPTEIPQLGTILAGSENPDVTGGMRSKVINMMKLVENRDCQEVTIFSGAVPGNILKAFSGATLGTRLLLTCEEE